MSALGGMSESERQHVQARVRAAMDAQVVNEGRHQGDRAPYGYLAVDGGPHPNPREAAEGYRLRVLVIDEEAAEVARWIFAEYADSKGDRAIANGLNRDGIPCPRRIGPTRTVIGWRMVGRGARSGPFWRIRAMPAMPCLGGGPSMRCCLIRTTWRPGMWCGSAGRSRSGWFGRVGGTSSAGPRTTMH